jgi:large subunit ribosomal protein L25
MDQTLVTATTGRRLGSRPSRRLRAEGKLPGVVYGLGKDPVTVAVDYAELREALKTDAGLNTVIQLELGGTVETVIVRQVQRDPIKRVVTHADFMRVDPETPVRVRVPVKLVGDSSAVTNEGGMIEQKVFELEVECSPSNIPAEIEASMSMMTLDQGVTVGDLHLPPGVTTAVPDDISVVTPVVSRAAKVAARGAGGAADELDDLAGEDGAPGVGGADPDADGE